MFALVNPDKSAIALQCLQIAFVGNKIGQGQEFGSCIEDPPQDILRLRETAADVLRGILNAKEEKKEPKPIDQAASSVVLETYLQTRSRGDQSVRYFLDNCGNMLSEMSFMFSNSAGVPKDKFFAIIAAEALSKINENVSLAIARLLVNVVREGDSELLSMVEAISSRRGDGTGEHVVVADAACEVAVLDR